MRLLSRHLAIVVCIATGAAAQTTPVLPSYFKAPARMIVTHPDRIVIEDDASASFYVGGDTPHAVEKHGRRIMGYLMMNPDLDQEPSEIWAIAKPAFTKAGWKIVGERLGPPVVATMRRTVDFKDVWATFTARASGESTIEIIESQK